MKAVDNVYLEISIHVPAWGTTRLPQSAEVSHKFQSTFPRGERRDVSPVQDRTLNNFNPRSRVGNDNNEDEVFSSFKLFQSTFPRGERQETDSNRRSQGYISIHVPAWGTTKVSDIKSLTKEFQSTFPRGERQYF